jgi:hypothetical protein
MSMNNLGEDNSTTSSNGIYTIAQGCHWQRTSSSVVWAKNMNHTPPQ